MATYHDSIQNEPQYNYSLAQISHEIRNPLTLITCTLQLLTKKYPELSQDELWTQLSGDIDYLKQLTTSFTSLAHGEDLSFRPSQLNYILENLMKNYLPMAQSENKNLLLHLDDSLPQTICDEVKIKQALINLLKNAFEATESGDTIEVSARSNLNRLTISIRDTGKGIPKDSLQNIFNPFYTNKKNGNGLGLPITKKIIAAHKGTIRVYSKIGVGTKFMIILPVLPVSSTKKIN